MTVIPLFARACSRQSVSKSAALFRASNGVSRVAVSNSNHYLVSQSYLWPFQDTFTASLTKSYATEANSTPGRPKAHTGRAKATKQKSSTKKASTKASGSKKAAAKKPAAKRKAAKKPKRRTKAKAKPKSKPKPKPRGRKLSEKAKERAAKQKATSRKKQLESDALISSEPKGKPRAPYRVFVSEISEKGTGAVIREAAARYKSVSAEDKERYAQLAAQNQAQNQAEYQKWLQSFTPDQIRVANHARLSLRRLKRSTSKRTVHTPRSIIDERTVKKSSGAYIFFYLDRQKSGDFSNMAVIEASKLIADEWKRLGDVEKKVYKDKQLADDNRYRTEYKTVYGHDAPPVQKPKAATTT